MTYSPRVYGAKKNSGSKNAICECHVRRQTPNRGRELAWELNGDQSQIAGAGRRQNVRGASKTSTPGHEAVHAKGEIF